MEISIETHAKYKWLQPPTPKQLCIRGSGPRDYSRESSTFGWSLSFNAIFRNSYTCQNTRDEVKKCEVKKPGRHPDSLALHLLSVCSVHTIHSAAYQLRYFRNQIKIWMQTVLFIIPIFCCCVHWNSRCHWTSARKSYRPKCVYSLVVLITPEWERESEWVRVSNKLVTNSIMCEFNSEYSCFTSAFKCDGKRRSRRRNDNECGQCCCCCVWKMWLNLLLLFY